MVVYGWTEWAKLSNEPTKPLCDTADDDMTADASKKLSHAPFKIHLVMPCESMTVPWTWCGTSREKYEWAANERRQMWPLQGPEMPTISISPWLSTHNFPIMILWMDVSILAKEQDRFIYYFHYFYSIYTKFKPSQICRCCAIPWIQYTHNRVIPCGYAFHGKRFSY